VHAQQLERQQQNFAIEVRLLHDQHALQLKVAEGKAGTAVEHIKQLEKEKADVIREKDAIIQQLQAEHKRQLQQLIRAQLPSRR